MARSQLAPRALLGAPQCCTAMWGDCLDPTTIYLCHGELRLGSGESTLAAILIVEDDEQVRVLAESYFRDQGHQTLTAATTEQALAVLDEHDKIDVLFVDVELDEGRQEGLDLARQAVLERLGWTFVPIRGSQFLRDPDGTIEPLLGRLKTAGIEPVASEESEEPAVAQEFELRDRVLGRAQEIRRLWRGEGPADAGLAQRGNQRRSTRRTTSKRGRS